MQLLGRITLNVLAHDTQSRWCGLQRDLLGLLKLLPALLCCLLYCLPLCCLLCPFAHALPLC